MAKEVSARASQQQIRRYCHQIVDKVAGLTEGRLWAAEQALQQAPSDAIRQTLVETSASAPDETTAAFVSAAVRGGNVQLARAAADLLLDIKDAASARAVISECLRADDLSVRHRAVEALETLDDPAAVDLLTEALGSEDDGVRRAATSTVGLVMGSKYHPLKEMMLERVEDCESDLHRTIVGSEDVGLRRELAQGLGFADSERVLPLLGALSKDSDEQTRREVVFALSAQRSDAALDVLEDMLEDSDDVVVGAVLDVLATHLGRDSRQMLGSIQKALHNPLRQVRRQAVLMLDQFNPSEVKEIVAEAARDKDFEVQRSALTLLRRHYAESGAVGLGEGSGEYSPEEQMLMIWQAGEFGMDARVAAAPGVGGDAMSGLERVALTGSLSARMHAIGELQQLRDIADSPALQRALQDPDDSVRSRAAAGLGYTRDAGLLTKILSEHPDFLLRRRAVEALMQNPAGPKGEEPGRRGLSFTSTRSVSMELFSYFLAALEDRDESVRQLACNALGRYVEFRSPMPVPTVVHRLGLLSEDESLSSLVREGAAELVEELEEAAFMEPLVKLADAAVEWRGRLAREAHALRREGEGGGFILDGRSGLDPENLAQGWQKDLGLTAAQSQAASAALRSGEVLPDEVAQVAARGMVRCLVAALNGLYHAAHAVALLGDKRCLPSLQKWARAVSSGPVLEWGEEETFGAWRTMLPRLRARASVAAVAAAEVLKGSPDPSVLDASCAHEDEWIRTVALTERAGMEEDAGGILRDLAALCRTHAEEPDFIEPVGRAAVTLVEGGQAEFIPVAHSILEQAQTDLRLELTQRLLVAAQEESVAGMLHGYLSGKPVRRMGLLCLALAFRGAGNDVGGLELPEALPEGAEVELLCAHRALGAMLEDERAAEALKESLRGGQERERYCAAGYLGMARVQSAAPVFASISDRDVPWSLRSLCGGMLVRCGHRQGMSWFAKNIGHSTNAQEARMAVDLSRAVEDVIPLMLECKDVNLGRFV